MRKNEVKNPSSCKLLNNLNINKKKHTNENSKTHTLLLLLLLLNINEIIQKIIRRKQQQN